MAATALWMNTRLLENILTALGGLEQILISEEVEITIKKIEAMVSPLAPKSSIQLSFYDWEGRAELRQTLKTCQEAILKRRLVSFDYMDKNGTATKRTVEPYQLHFSETSWYLKGYCLHPQNSHGFQFLASFGTNLEIVEPKTYIEHFRNYLFKMMEKYA